MENRIAISSAGNTLAPALACLRTLGFQVSRTEGEPQLYRAENLQSVFVADDPLALLGLVKLLEVRGSQWQASDAEIDSFLQGDGDTP